MVYGTLNIAEIKVFSFYRHNISSVKDVYNLFVKNNYQEYSLYIFIFL